MDKIGRGKWAGCIASGVLLRLLCFVTAQPGFLSITCGGKANYTAENNIEWVTDDNYIGVGQTANIGDASKQAYGSYLHTLRFFPKPLNKTCYQLTVAPNVPYLLRLWFTIGDYSGFQQSPSFAVSIETLGLLSYANISFADYNTIFFQGIFVSSGKLLYICLIRTSETSDPFINAIELRTLQDGMYGQAKPGTLLFLMYRIDCYGNSTAIRYPQDNFDRIWESDRSDTTSKDNNIVPPVTSQHAISSKNTKDLPPTAVMQTAWVLNSSESNYLEFTLGFTRGKNSVLVLYFAELETLNMSESRSFYVSINGGKRSDIITMVPNYSALELTFLSDATDNLRFDIIKAANSTRGPIINAYEYYLVYDTEPATYSQDLEALDAIKWRFDIKDWMSDPCYLIQWEGISCDNSSSAIRVSQLNLSGRNLSGSVPEDIGLLTSLVNMFLDNNNLTGPLPNFSNLTSLERLYLQNNNLNGTLPYWLFELKNLTELIIENNNFSGVIPRQLLNTSLQLNYSGNPYLFMSLTNSNNTNGQYIVSKSKKRKVWVVVGIAISGILLVALALIVGIVLYCKKFRNVVKNEQQHLVDPDYSMIMVPNPTKSRAFTQNEMIAATQNFSQKIGRGGFGWVFFGTLPEGIHIAVKVLSLFSKQGIQEFLNEVDLLSRVHHRNLVRLLGYCSESREVMLIYEHMSGGSLRDQLYGPSGGHSELNWKTRVKIALDAAQGLEYLHMGCIPKIIHRDVKTTNILLDSNMNGKLSDFGLSRMTIDGETTHVITAVKGTAGYLDPEYFNTQMLTEKSDVYSFGVILLELICGRQPIDVKLPADELNIIRWVTPYVEMDESAGISKIIDRSLAGNYNIKSITRVAKLAMRCIEAEPSCRPIVTEVVAELREAIKEEDIDIKCGDMLAEPVHLSVESSGGRGMDWGDDSSNILQVGR